MFNITKFSLIIVILFTNPKILISEEGTFPMNLILINGKVWTGDSKQPYAQGVAIFQDKIIKVGTTEEVAKLIDKRTEVIDLRGRLVLPGFIDSHVHFTSGGFWLSGVQLKDCTNPEEFGERLQKKSNELPPNAWITGGSWDHENWKDTPLPVKELIDRYVPDRPVFVSRYDGHMGVANSLALKLAGITEKSEDPSGGMIVRKPGSREPAGVLKDAAISLVESIIPEPSLEEIEHTTEAALAQAREYGVTSVKYMGASPEDIKVYQRLLDKNRLTLRIEANVPLSQWREIKKTGLIGNYNNHLLKIGRLKAFVDGSLGSNTALFFEPYHNQPDTRGLLVSPKEKLLKEMLSADIEGFTFSIHAIGDSANSLLLDIYEEVQKINGTKDRRWKIEHAQHIAPKDFQRFAQSGIIASVQPYHAIDDGRWAESRIGYERCRTSYAFRTFLDNKVTMIFGSDWTVAPLNPLTGIYAAVTRRTLDGKNPDGWFPEQKISVEEAVRAYTVTGAYAGFEENILGSITPGKLADLVVLSDDIFTINPEKIPDTKVMYTIFNGKVVYKR